MKISTDRAMRPATSHRDVLHRIAWAADGLDPELAATAIGVLSELEAAEAEIERLKMEAADRSAVSAEQIALPVRERIHLAAVGSHSPALGEAGERFIAALRVVGGS